MFMNLAIVLIGAVLLVYGIKSKTKFFIIAGCVLLGFGLISAGIDYKMGAAGGVDNHRVPFVINAVMR